MSTREIVFLGTSSQVPTKTRNHNAMFLFWDDIGVLFDPGEGTQRQMTLAGISATRITHIAITHFHGDHCLGLAGVIQRLSLDGTPHAVEVFFPASGQVYFDRLRNATIFHDAAKIVPRPFRIQRDEIVELFNNNSLSLHAAALEHSVDCYGYRLQEADGRTMMPDLLARHGISGPMVGTLRKEGAVTINGATIKLEDVSLTKPGQSMALVMDTRPCNGARKLAQDVTLLVAESTYLNSEMREAHDHFHMTAEQSATLARDAGAKQLALTHFSPRYTSHQEFVDEASPIFPDVVVADDLIRVKVNRPAK
jgi:ribonuclease Z